MRKINLKSNIKDTTEVGQGIIDINKINAITEDVFFTITFDLLLAKTDELFGKIRAGWMESELQEKDEAIQDVHDLDDLIGDLEESHADFDISVGKHLRDLSVCEKSKSASVVVKELRDIINGDLCEYIVAMAKSNPDKSNGFCRFDDYFD